MNRQLFIITFALFAAFFTIVGFCGSEIGITLISLDIGGKMTPIFLRGENAYEIAKILIGFSILLSLADVRASLNR